VTLNRKNTVLIFSLLLAFLFSSSAAQLSDSLIIPYNYINSIPQNAGVYYNDSLVGFTPLRLTAKLSYPGTLMLIHKGYNDIVYQVQSSDTLLNKTFYLSPSFKNSRNTGEQLVIENKNSMFKKPRKILPVAAFGIVTIGSAASAYYFKNLANDRYDEYLQSGEQNLLDKTKKYDLISGISMAVFQIGLIGLFYFLFIE